MRRGPVHDVELVEDDEPDAGAAPADDHASSRRSRTALLVGGGLVAALVVTGVVGQAVVDRRERAVIAAVAAHPGSVELLDGPPSVRWQRRADTIYRLADVRTDDGLLVGVVHAGTGPVAVHALDPRTGDEVWRVELLDGSARASLDGREGHLAPWSYSGNCTTGGSRTDVVVCSVHDGAELWDDRGGVTVPPTTMRVVALSTRDGSVVTEYTDALDARPTSAAPVGDVLVLAVPHDGTTEVVAVGPDGEVAWRHEMPQPRADETFVEAAGDVVVARTPHEARLLDAAGDVVRTVSLGPDDGVWVDPYSSVVRVVRLGGQDTSEEHTRVLRDEGDVTLEGFPVPLAVDDGSVPGLQLTYLDGRTSAWDARGELLWSTAESHSSEALLVDGRLHVDAAGAVLTLDARTGEELWRVPGTVSAPVTDGRHVLVLVLTGGRTDLVALDPSDGSETWRVESLPDVDGLESYHRMLVAVDDDGVDGGGGFAVLR